MASALGTRLARAFWFSLFGGTEFESGVAFEISDAFLLHCTCTTFGLHLWCSSSAFHARLLMLEQHLPYLVYLVSGVQASPPAMRGGGGVGVAGGTPTISGSRGC